MTAWLAITVAAVDKRMSGTSPQLGAIKWRRILDCPRVVKNERALAEIIARMRRQNNERPGGLNGFAEMTHIGIERFGAGHCQEDAAEDDKPDCSSSVQKLDAWNGAQSR